MSSSAGGSDSGLSKYQLLGLLGLGVSVAIVGIGTVWYIKRKRPDNDSTVTPNQNANNVPQVKEMESINDIQSPVVQFDNPALDQALEIKAKGNELFKQKKFEEALPVYEEALSVCPDDRNDDLAAINHNIAACIENMIPSIGGKDEKDEMWKNVVTRCTIAINLKPKYIKALIRRYKAFNALDKTRDALLDIVRVLVLDESQSQQFQGAMPTLLKKIGLELAEANYQKLKPLEPPTQLIRAYFDTYIWKDDLSKTRLKALATDSSIDINDNNEPFVIAAALYKDNSFSNIIEVLTNAIDNGSDIYKPHGYLLRGTLYCLWRRDKDGLQDLQKVLEWKNLPAEMYADAHIKRAAIFAGLCELDKCHEEFEAAIIAKPDHADIYIQRARVSLESEDVNVLMKAPDDLDIALKLAPTAPHTRYCLGAVYHRGGLLSGSMHLLQGARTHFEEAYNMHPECVEGIILYSLYLQDAQEIDKCEQLLEKAIKLEPDNSSVHFSLSLLYLLVHQDINKAIKSLETAVAMDSSCIQAYEALASLEMQRGNKEKAHQLYNQAIDNSRSMMELQQAYIAYEVYTTQNQACEEYNINPLDLMTSRIAAANNSLQ